MVRRLVPLLTTATFLAPFLASCGSGGIDVYMSLDANGARKRTRFYTDTESIDCVAEVPAPRDGLTVTALVRMIRMEKNVNYILAIGEQVPSKQASGAGTPKVSFAVTKSAAPTSSMTDFPWPVGSFQCEVSVDGVLKGIAPFEIVMPQCPLYPASTGTSCMGFYPQGARCPAADQTILCTCTNIGAWECDR